MSAPLVKTQRRYLWKLVKTSLKIAKRSCFKLLWIDHYITEWNSRHLTLHPMTVLFKFNIFSFYTKLSSLLKQFTVIYMIAERWASAWIKKQIYRLLVAWLFWGSSTPFPKVIQFFVALMKQTFFVSTKMFLLCKDHSY
jgi:hypothetical protein